MSAPLLTARGITKKYGSVTALAGADLTVYPGEVCSLVGDNGAGKSTLVKILSGAETPTSGTISVGGTDVHLPNPAAAQEKGIATVFQDLALAPELDATENMYLGRELLRPGILGRVGVLDRATMKRDAAEQFSKLGITLRSPTVSVGSLSGGQRQSVAIARAAKWADNVIFLDEPTAALGVVQTDRVLRLVRQVADQGLGVVLITHNMTHVVDVSDRVEVLRLGGTVARFTRGEATVQKLVEAMTSGTTSPQENP
ncbi:sugar ABC transporter ATP-binding protein [Rhodococcus sp. WS3]|uniref:ATP-binding cassette domain-containing protein n=1 Tax=unclassified Rhodococcus (in: high G+C Gram-positive bacteria) TaxID=192944 RepID=UPI0005D32A3C|nr:MULTISPECIES: ATP-binding cassette domain-containing protein [unclassified Rhodococcus (in: high G+C Gram-positive bacteria)]KJF19302.1 Ribose import ATP-binding protein RbsA [Rhodococcus sp. AD45]ROZ42742.1 sugar ABC transporter ATP-binding protein [Rhodococcus sp. WS3]RZL21771.1 MAG: sugar ABC transporter ATP-binding protein [Rhodococcus sp. (in: high G+C Gram-positive bacteria)]